MTHVEVEYYWKLSLYDGIDEHSDAIYICRDAIPQQICIIIFYIFCVLYCILYACVLYCILCWGIAHKKYIKKLYSDRYSHWSTDTGTLHDTYVGSKVS